MEEEKESGWLVHCAAAVAVNQMESQVVFRLIFFSIAEWDKKHSLINSGMLRTYSRKLEFIRQTQTRMYMYIYIERVSTLCL